tara:strand:+ start:71 stop:319 length:249 start_codon:yes stop_codon:yes gene_type:complete
VVVLVVQTLLIMDQMVIHLYFQLSHLLVVEVVEVIQVELVNLEALAVVEQVLRLITKLDVETLPQQLLLKGILEEQVDQVNL